jgi:3-oxoacyl-[acyl-carrier-protein] synthase III
LSAPAAGSQIVGFGHYAPERVVPSAEIEARLGLEPGWIARRTGIVERHYAAEGQALTDIAFAAGEMALADAGIDRSQIALLLLATSTPDNPLPPSAPLLAHRLGLAGAGGIDMAGACAGFIYALTLADAFVRVQGAPVMVVAANVLSRRINPQERASSVLFSDAAAAVVLVPTSEAGTGVLGAKLAAGGDSYDLIKIAAGGSCRPFAADVAVEETLMTIADGRAVFAKAVAMMVETAREALQRAGLTIDDIDLFVPHQANARIIAATARQLGVPADKIVSTVAHFGNSSAATIPFTLSSAAHAGGVQRGARILMCAAGAGLTGGGVVFRC